MQVDQSSQTLISDQGLRTGSTDVLERSTAFGGKLAQLFSARVHICRISQERVGRRLALVVENCCVEPSSLSKDERKSHNTRWLAKVEASAESMRRYSQSMAHAIHGFAEETHSGLIVVSLPEEDGPGEQMSQSIAEQVIRTAACPVLTIGPRCELPEVPSLDLREIISATDFFPAAERAMRHALQIARLTKARLCLCYAIGELDPTAAGDQLLEQALRSKLRTLLTKATCPEVMTEIVVRRGDPVTMILDLARERRPDLVVLGAGGTSSIVSQTHRKIASLLLPLLRCPLLTIR